MLISLYPWPLAILTTWFLRSEVGLSSFQEDVADVLVKLPNPSTVRFRAMQRGNTPLLVVNEDNGEISIGAKIDREQLCQKNLNCSIVFGNFER